MLHSPDAEKSAETILENPKHPAFAALWKTIADRGYGKAVAQVELSGPGGGPVPHELVVRFTRAERKAS